LHKAFADNCTSLKWLIKSSHQQVIDKSYPYWYSVAQAKKESNCRWVTSKDGWGSVGYFQLTPKMLDSILRPLYPKYKEISYNHFLASAYYMKLLHKQNPCKKLFVTYQMFNGGNWVIRECKKANSWKWKDCKNNCLRGNVCVWKVNGVCKMFKSACDINYNYSIYIYKWGQYYRAGGDNGYNFW